MNSVEGGSECGGPVDPWDADYTAAVPIARCPLSVMHC